MRARVSEDIAELAVGHVRADLIARYNKDEAWESRCDAFTRVSDHIATLIGARTGAAVILARGGEPVSRRFLFLRPVVTQICEHKIKNAREGIVRRRLDRGESTLPQRCR